MTISNVCAVHVTNPGIAFKKAEERYAALEIIEKALFNGLMISHEFQEKNT